jgi:hypothetical protein
VAQSRRPVEPVVEPAVVEPVIEQAVVEPVIEPAVGLEPTTWRLQVACATNCATPA